MQATRTVLNTLFLLILFCSAHCVRSKSTSSFTDGNVDRAVAEPVQRSGLEASMASPEAEAKMNEILEGDLLDLMEKNLAFLKATTGNADVEYNGYHFYDLELELASAIEFMREEGIGRDYKIKDLLEDQGLSVSDLKKGRVPMEVVEAGMEVSSQFFEKGFDLFNAEASSEAGSEELMLGAGLPRHWSARNRAKLGTQQPKVNCGAAGKAETAAAITGGVCGGAALACVIGALPTMGAACIGLAVCGAAAGATGGGAAAAKAAGGC